MLSYLGLVHGFDIVEGVAELVCDAVHASLLQFWVCLDLPKHSMPPFLAGI